MGFRIDTDERKYDQNMLEDDFHLGETRSMFGNLSIRGLLSFRIVSDERKVDPIML